MIRILDGRKVSERGIDLNAGKPIPLECFDVTYVGAVLDVYENNGYHDSDFYAVAWDGEKVVDVQYATTRGWTYANFADVDATQEVIGAATAWWLAAMKRTAAYAIRGNKTPYIGATATVVQGRKVKPGTSGLVISLSKRPGYGYQPAYEVALLQVSEKEAVEVRASYLEVTPDPERVERLVRDECAKIDRQHPCWRGLGYQFASAAGIRF